MNNRKLFFLICISIFVIPLSCLIPLGTDLWYIQFLSLFCMFCLGVSIYLWNRNKLLSTFTVYCLFNAMVVTRQHPKTIIVLVMIYLGCLAVEIVSNLTKKQKWAVLWCIVTITIFQGIFVIVQFFDLDPFFKAIKEERFFRTVGLSGSRNQLGLFFAVVSPVILSMAPYILPLVVFGVFCSATGSAWVGLIAGCITYICYKSGNFFKVISILLVCTVIFFVKFENISLESYKERFDLYKHTIQSVENEHTIMRINKDKVTAVKEVTCNKWFGYGLATFTRISPYTQYGFLNRKMEHVYSHAHNDLLEIWFELGRIGFVLALLLICRMVWDFIKARKTKLLVISFSCLVAQIVSAQGIFTVHTAMGGLLLIVFYGIFRGEINEQRDYRKITRTSFLV